MEPDEPNDLDRKVRSHAIAVAAQEEHLPALPAAARHDRSDSRTAHAARRLLAARRPIEQAATVQHQFLHIFPFAEHSGKISRMCSNLIQPCHHFLPCVIHSIDRQKYYESFRGPVASFRLLLVDAMDNSLDNALKYFRDLSRRYRAIN